VRENATQFDGDVSQGFILGGTSSGAHLAAMSAYRAISRSQPVTGIFQRAPMVFDRKVAKDNWKETLEILPKDVYCPFFNWDDLVRHPICTLSDIFQTSCHTY
jgi:hypothetical protein